MRGGLMRVPRARAWAVVLCAGAAASLSVAPASADVGTSQEPIPGTPYAIEVPEGWDGVQLPKKLTIRSTTQMFKQHPAFAEAVGVDPTSKADVKAMVKALRGNVRLAAADVTGDGDNVVVRTQRQDWWNDLDEFRQAMELVASTTNAEVLFDRKSKVGSDEAYMHLEQDPPQRGGHIFAELDIRTGPNSLVAVSVSIDGDSRALAESILKSVTVRSP